MLLHASSINELSLSVSWIILYSSIVIKIFFVIKEQNKDGTLIFGREAAVPEKIDYWEGTGCRCFHGVDGENQKLR